MFCVLMTLKLTSIDFSEKNLLIQLHQLMYQVIVFNFNILNICISYFIVKLFNNHIRYTKLLNELNVNNGKYLNYDQTIE